MARIKLSPLISSINGKLGNAVFQGGKSGIILREKAIPRNLNTTRQVMSRNRLSQVKAAWQGLADIDRNSWKTFSIFFKRSTKNSATRFLSAYELFISYNVIRLQSGSNILLNTTLEVQVVENVTVSIFVLTASTLRVFAEIIPLDIINWIDIYISRPFKPTQSIAKSEVRFMRTDENDGSLSDLTEEYLAVFHTLPEKGSKVLVKIKGHLENSGWSSKDVYIEVIIP